MPVINYGYIPRRRRPTQSEVDEMHDMIEIVHNLAPNGMSVSNSEIDWVLNRLAVLKTFIPIGM